MREMPGLQGCFAKAQQLIDAMAKETPEPTDDAVQKEAPESPQ
jgi:hypothetical protein